MRTLQKILLGIMGAGLIMTITGSKINNDYLRGFGAGALMSGGIAGLSYLLTNTSQYVNYQPKPRNKYKRKNEK